MTDIIVEPCIGTKDTACVDVCPVECIDGKDEDRETLYVHPEECIDCGPCVDACPVEAILPLELVPEKWSAYIARNYWRSTDLGYLVPFSLFRDGSTRRFQ